MNPISNIKTKTISLENFKYIFILNIQDFPIIYLEMLINIKSRNDIVLHMKEPGVIGNFCKFIFKGYYRLDFDKTHMYDINLDSNNQICLTHPISRINRYIELDNIKYLTKIKVLVPKK